MVNAFFVDRGWHAICISPPFVDERIRQIANEGMQVTRIASDQPD
jgi:hypothetical protein